MSPANHNDASCCFPKGGRAVGGRSASYHDTSCYSPQGGGVVGGPSVNYGASGYLPKSGPAAGRPSTNHQDASGFRPQGGRTTGCPQANLSDTCVTQQPERNVFNDKWNGPCAFDKQYQMDNVNSNVWENTNRGLYYGHSVTSHTH